MSFATEQIARLESLLARIQRRVAEPRVPRAVAIADKSMVPADPTPPYTPVLTDLTAEQQTEPVLHAAPQPATIEAEPEVGLHAPEQFAPVLEATAEDIEPDVTAIPKHIEPVVEAAPERISGEFPVAEEMLELEELGPASEFDNDPVVEATLEPVVEPAPEPIVEATLEPIVEAAPEPIVEAAPEPIAEAAAAEELREEHEEREQPPESGRELVAAPHESQRVAVAAPSTPAAPDEASLELHEQAPQEQEAPASSRRLSAAAPSQAEPEPLHAEPSTFDEVFEVPPKLQAPIAEVPSLDLHGVSEVTDDDAAPPPMALSDQLEVDRSVHAASIPPEPHLVSAGLDAELDGPASGPVELDRGEHAIEPAAEPHLVTEESVEPPTLVARAPVIESSPPEAAPPEPAPIEAAPIEAAPIEAAPIELPGPDVVRAHVVPADVAAYILAARAPRPETFGALLDAALEL